jgi:hypothetical protein
MELSSEFVLRELERPTDDFDPSYAAGARPFLVRHRARIRIRHCGGVPLGFGHCIQAAPVDVQFALSGLLHDSVVVPLVPPIGPR